MFDITHILTPETTRVAVHAQSRKRAIEVASDLLAARHPDLSARALFDELMNRERLGSTGLGEGVAIPHCRTGPCEQILGAFLNLSEPVDYDAAGRPAGRPAVCAGRAAGRETTAHLEVLAVLARLFQNPENRRAAARRRRPTARPTRI